MVTWDRVEDWLVEHMCWLLGHEASRSGSAQCVYCGKDLCMATDADLEKIQAQLDRYPAAGRDKDDEEDGYVQGLEDAARLLQGLRPRFREQ